MARPTLFNHRKFHLLVHRLRGDRATAVGSLELLWHVAYESGDPEVGNALQIEQAASWRGEPGMLFAALVEAGFLDEVEGKPGVYEIHDLWHHCPEYVTKRKQREATRKNRYAPRNRPRKGDAPEIPNSEFGRLTPELGGLIHEGPGIRRPNSAVRPPSSGIRPDSRTLIQIQNTPLTPQGGEGGGKVPGKVEEVQAETDLSRTASRVVQHYHEKVGKAARVKPGAVAAVEALLAAGSSESELRLAADRYAAQCDRLDQQRRVAAATFYGRSGWRDYLLVEGDPEQSTPSTYTPPPRRVAPPPSTGPVVLLRDIMAAAKPTTDNPDLTTPQSPQDAPQAPSQGEGRLDAGSCQDGPQAQRDGAGAGHRQKDRQAGEPRQLAGARVLEKYGVQVAAG